MWDLDEDREVTFITKINDFASHRTYTPTGFFPYLPRDGKTKDMSQAKFFSQNEDRSLVSTPNTEKVYSQMIRTYQGINLMDLLDIRSRIRSNKLVLDTSVQTML